MNNNIYINKVKKSAAKFLAIMALPLASVAGSMMTSCSDKMDSENYYTFTGKMMSEYLKTNENLSQFATIVEKAGLMDQLSAYGHYTCFAPTNAALTEYLANEKRKTLDELTKEDCDTIARTHLVGVAYSSLDLAAYNNLTLGTQNMMMRNLKISQQKNADGKTEFVVNNKSVIPFELQDDSVENGIVQPVNKVIVNSTSSVVNLIKQNCAQNTGNVGKQSRIFFEALSVTGLELYMDTLVEDHSYNVRDYKEYESYNTGAEGHELAIAPKTRKYGFTVFVCPDDVLNAKGINSVEDLYKEACRIYDPFNTYAGTIDNAADKDNPLYKLMAYHILNRNVQSYNYLTVREDLGVDYNYANTTDWYATMLPGSIMKVEHLINKNAAWLEGGVYGDRYINRRIDDKHKNGVNGTKGAHVINPDEDYDATNGIYFYVDDLLKFDDVTKDIVCNTRIRMDMSTFFPELATNNIRLNGKWDDYSRTNLTDENIGFNYYFPNNPKTGKNYLDGVILHTDNSLFVYRRPRLNFYSMHGDEMNAFKEFDIEFNLPPFPFEGQWQLRLGFAPMDDAPRGAIQCYFDGEPTGIPLNMDLQISSAEVYGGSLPSYSNIRENEEERIKDFKILKQKGYYRGPYSIFHANKNDPSGAEKFAQQQHTVRKVLCTVNISKSDLSKVHTLRIKNVSKTNASSKEAMLDYIEFVPRSVYGISDDGDTEDDL